MLMTVHPRRSTMPFCVLVSFLVLLAAPTSSFHAAASSSRGQAHRTPSLRWKQRGARGAVESSKVLEDPVDKWGDVHRRKWCGRLLRHYCCLPTVSNSAVGIPAIQLFISQR